MKLSELQSHIKEFDHAPELPEHYFLKLVEEIGELSESIREGKSGQPCLEELKGSIAEELYDVLYYVCALANICLLYTSPSPRDRFLSRMPSSA